MAHSRITDRYKAVWEVCHQWALVVSPRAMRLLPMLYLSILAGLLILGVLARHMVVLTSNAVVQAQTSKMPVAVSATSQTSSSALPAKGKTHDVGVHPGGRGQDPQASANPDPLLSSGQSVSPNESAKEEKELKEWLSTFQWILGLIITVAGLFTVAQGIATGFSTARFTQQAEKDLDKIAKTTGEIEEIKGGAIDDVDRLKRITLKEIDDLKKGIEAKYPDFLLRLAKMRVYAQGLLAEQLKKSSPVGSADEGYDHSLQFYANIPTTIRQTIQSVERALPYEIAGQQEEPGEYAVQLQRLARFYWSKFLYESRLGFGYLGDLERAEYLLSEGVSRSNLAFTFYNDLGSVNMDFYRVMKKLGDIDAVRKYFNKAEDYFLKSKELQPEQLRAYFDLAVIEAEHRGKMPRYFGSDTAKHLHRALVYMQEGLKLDSSGSLPTGATSQTEPFWETEPIPAYVCAAYFNLGCYYARLAVLEPMSREEHIGRCLDALRHAAALGLMKPADVQDEFVNTSNTETGGRKGDFWDLLQIANGSVLSELEKLRGQLSRNRPVREDS